jgi:hypothetical protein
VVVAVAAVVAVVTFDDQRPAPPVTAPPISAAAAATPATPEHPSGRFLPGWLPGNLRVAVEEEWAAGKPGNGWTRTYIRRGSVAGDQDVLTISLEDGAPALDFGTEASRYAGSRLVTVQGVPALSLELVAARHDAVLAWNPAPGRLAQVLGSGVSAEELAGVAEAFLPPPRLDATPVPEGFAEIQRSDDHPYPAAVPRQYAVNTVPLRGGARPPGTPSVMVVGGWGDELPPGGTAVTVRDRPGVASTEGDTTLLGWSERPGLVVTVTGTNVGLDDVRRTATELRELSVEEVLARPTGAPALVARGVAAGEPYELRLRSGPSGPCLELAHNWVQSQCSGDPMQAVVAFQGAIFQGLAYGSVVLDAASVRIELDGGRMVDTVPVGKAAGVGTAFFVADVPPDARLLAVTALGADGNVLRRTPAG